MRHLVFDIGGSFVKFGIISKDNKISNRGKFTTPRDSKEKFLEKIKKVYNEFKDTISGIGISMPGKIDIHNGYAYSAGALLYLEETNIVDMFHEFTDLPVAVENDGKCAALAESWFGSLREVESGIAIVFGTGVGGGIILNDKLHRGYNNVSGEFSFILNSTDKPIPKSFGIDGSVYSLIKAVEKAEGLKSGSLTGEEVFNKINSNDKRAYNALQDYCETIVFNLYNLQHIFDPERISIGGGISEQEAFIDCLKKKILAYKEDRPYLLATPSIIQSKFRNDSNLLGALVNFHINQIKKTI